MTSEGMDMDTQLPAAVHFHDHIQGFLDGSDTPRAYLERCLAVIATKEPVLRTWVVLNLEGARAMADAATTRYQAGRPLSLIDGMPIGIKDLMETKDMPTQFGSAAFAGSQPRRDTALVQGLRQAGAVFVGKTVTAELGGAGPGPTTNPFDVRRTPGGSSSGSAAAVAAGMVPAAMGSQLSGSVIRPASYCGNYAIKPTQGALNRGERQGSSQSTVGVHANNPADMWQVMMAIVQRVGGDPGHPGLFGPEHVPDATRPNRLIVIQTEGWSTLDAGSKDAFERLIVALREAGIAVMRRADHPLVEAFEQGIAGMTAISRDIGAFEARCNLENLVEQYGPKLSHFVHAQLAAGRRIDLERYRSRLLERDEARLRLAAAARFGDAFLTLSAAGPAPFWDPDAPEAASNLRPTGVPSFNMATSLLGLPAVTAPMLSVGGMPLGVQVVGLPHEDARMTSYVRWIGENIMPIAV
jgi:Asp-tRNA(Asn)/Glu-tRNA(Gln) amidotransferase A subunit family amidase